MNICTVGVERLADVLKMSTKLLGQTAIYECPTFINRKKVQTAVLSQTPWQWINLPHRAISSVSARRHQTVADLYLLSVKVAFNTTFYFAQSGWHFLKFEMIQICSECFFIGDVFLSFSEIRSRAYRLAVKSGERFEPSLIRMIVQPSWGWQRGSKVSSIMT